jgi:hypothetical protein
MKYYDDSGLLQIQCLNYLDLDTTEHFPQDLKRYAISIEYFSLIIEYVFKTLCRTDPIFSEMYITRVFGTQERRYLRNEINLSGSIRFFSREHISYYSKFKKSWCKVPTFKSLKTWKAIQKVLEE